MHMALGSTEVVTFRLQSCSNAIYGAVPSINTADRIPFCVTEGLALMFGLLSKLRLARVPMLELCRWPRRHKVVELDGGAFC